MDIDSMDAITTLKVELAAAIERIDEIKLQQAHQALIWAADSRPTSLANRLKLEYELTEAKSLRNAIEAKIVMAKANKPKEANPYYSELCRHLIDILTERDLCEVIQEAKRRIKEAK